MVQSLLIIGATGNLGGATIDALLRTMGDRKIRALARDPASKRALALKRRGVDLVCGDLDDETSVKHAIAGAYGVYSVQSPEKAGPEGEARQGMMVASAARQAGVAHFVYSSVAGADRQSGVPHFERKWGVEQHIVAIGLPATIIRPVLFMDNFGTFAFRAIMLAMLRTFVPENQMTQMVATRDIGTLVATAFGDAERCVGRFRHARQTCAITAATRHSACGVAQGTSLDAGADPQGVPIDDDLDCCERVPGQYRRAQNRVSLAYQCRALGGPCPFLTHENICARTMPPPK